MCLFSLGGDPFGFVYITKMTLETAWKEDLEAGQEALDEGRFGVAEQRLSEALQSMQKQLGHSHPELAPALECLAKLYSEQRKYVRGRAFYRRLLKLKEETQGEDCPEVAAIKLNIAMIRNEKDKILDKPEP